MLPRDGQIGNPNKNPGNPNKKKFLFGLSTQNLKNLGNPNKKSRNPSKKRKEFFVWITVIFVWISGIFVWISLTYPRDIE
jgi:hypothetical protein